MMTQSDLASSTPNVALNPPATAEIPSPEFAPNLFHNQ